MLHSVILLLLMLVLFDSLLQSDEKTRKKLYELRHTWNDVFAKSKLYMLDTKVQGVDPAWPVAAGSTSGTQVSSKPNIHINPNMIVSLI